MAATQTYKIRAIVLRKTKLGEKDLVVSMLSERGELVRAVAKGARRPGGSFASKLELFSCVDALMAKGRRLDVVTDARFTDAGPKAQLDLEQASCASALAELLAAISQEGLEHPRLFDMGRAAFDSLGKAQGERLILVTAAALLKAVASSGFRPNLDACVSCASPLDLSAMEGLVGFSVSDGGMACDSCPRLPDAVPTEVEQLRWLQALIYARFDEILGFDADLATAFAVLSLARRWCEFHAGKSLKSLDFLIVAGQF